MIEIDGSTGEGGGQILRTSLALAMCTGQGIRLERIRAKRSKPGLMRQHLTCVQAAAAVCNARVDGAELGSQTLVFEPGEVRAGDYSFNVGTAGSCTLVLQTVLPALMLASQPSRIELTGGTHNPMAPPFHFLSRSFAPLLRRLGAGLDLTLRRHGFYPAGGGEMTAEIHPVAAALMPFDLMERGVPRAAFAECLAPGLPRAVAQRELEALGQQLGWGADQLHTPSVRQNEGPGNALMATLEFEHACEVLTVFGERGVSAEKVAHQLAGLVRGHESAHGALGEHLADQWMLPLALAVRQSGVGARFTCTELTPHAVTNMQVIEAFLPCRFDIDTAAGCPEVRVSRAGAAAGDTR
jgi:RNA 3'-terminal phosphate cyclase (ATP)